MDIRRSFRRPLLAATAIVATLTAVPLAQAQPVVVVPPPGWVGPHYYYHGQHWHHRAWAWNHYHRHYYRYY